MANECIPLYRPGADLPCIAGTGGVTGKTFVNISVALNAATGVNPTVVTATAAALTTGVAAYDAPEGADVQVIAGPGIVLPVTAGGNIALGAEVEVGSSGRAVTLASGKARGRAVTAGTNGNDCFVQLY